MLFKELDKLKRTALMTTIVLIFIGFIMLILPEEYLPILNDSLAFCLLVAFVLSVLEFVGGSKTPLRYFFLGAGLLVGGLGIALLVFEELLIASLPWLIGVLPIVMSVYGIVHALIFARRAGRKGWWLLILLSALLGAFGIAVFFNPWMDNRVALMKIIGGTLMFSAFVSGLRLYFLWPLRATGEDAEA